MASIKDIAEAVGVSPSTVSRVINGKSYVNEAPGKRCRTCWLAPATSPTPWPKA